MITTAAVVKDGEVVNWIKVDDQDPPEIDGHEVVVTTDAAIGWLQQPDGTFAPPAPPADPQSE